MLIFQVIWSLMGLVEIYKNILSNSSLTLRVKISADNRISNSTFFSLLLFLQRNKLILTINGNIQCHTILYLPLILRRCTSFAGPFASRSSALADAPCERNITILRFFFYRRTVKVKRIYMRRHKRSAFSC